MVAFQIYCIMVRLANGWFIHNEPNMNIQTYKTNCNIHVVSDVSKNQTVHRIDNSWQHAKQPQMTNMVNNLRMQLHGRVSNIWHNGVDRQRVVYTHANQA